MTDNKMLMGHRRRFILLLKFTHFKTQVIVVNLIRRIKTLFILLLCQKSSFMKSNSKYIRGYLISTALLA